MSLGENAALPPKERDLLDIPPRPQVQGFLDASSGCATKVVLPSLHVRLKSPNALWRLYSYITTIAVLEGQGLYPIVFGQTMP